MEFVKQELYLDKEWLSSKLSQNVTSVTIDEKTEKMGGMSAQFIFLNVSIIAKETKSESIVPLVIKKSREPFPERMIVLGCAREALFYQQFAKKIQNYCPIAYHAEGDMKTSEYATLMECLNDAVPLGVFYGRGNPNNWSLTQEEITKLSTDTTAPKDPIEATKCAFSLIAQLHASFWMKQDLVTDESSSKWLQGADWMQGKNKFSWEQSQQMAKQRWKTSLKLIDSNKHLVKWDEHLIECLKTSFDKISWEGYQSELKSKSFTLIQGDCHPHNVLWLRKKENQVKLIDFEFVGVGSPSQQLGQFLLSHLDPVLRFKYEKELIKDYYHELISQGVDSNKYTFEECWSEYINGGFGRWVWFLAYFCNPATLDGSAAMCQFFHDQLAAFAKDHFPNPSDAPMPRV